jgi:FADH2 O2-dependent halogenase
MTSSKPDTDVAIIGGGPAGSSMAAYLARAGAKCVVLEAELFPRPHVGESLVPSTTRVFKELDFLKTMEERKYPRKYGAGWTAGNSANVYSMDWDALKGTNDVHPETEAYFRFNERSQPGVEQDYTYHVARGDFDNALLHHANRLGSEVYEGVRVRYVDFTDGELPRVKFNIGRKESELTAQIVVDASGRRTFLGNQLKLRIRDEVFDQFAIHTWFGDYDRNAWARVPAMKDYIFIHFMPLANTWVWQIPITDSITSIGAVTQRKYFPKTPESREAFFWSMLGSRPEIAERLQAATQLRPFTQEGDYSYAMKQICGDRWVMCGDAGRFVDPIFSTGVSIALNSSRFAHADILDALQSGNFKQSAFDRYRNTIRMGTNNWYKFISVYYRLNVLFTYFVQDPRYRLDVLQLLQGDVYQENEPPVLAKMRETVKEVEENPRHPWHQLLNDMTSHAFDPLF